MNLRNQWSEVTGVLQKASRWLPSIGLVMTLCASVTAQADEMKIGQFKLAKADTVLRGDAKCTGCHDESDNPKPTMLGENPHVLSIGKQSMAPPPMAAHRPAPLAMVTVSNT